MIVVMPTHQSKTGREIVLRITILNEALSLGAHDVVSEIGDAGSGRGTHDRGHALVVSRRPANRRQINPRILRRAVVLETAEAGIEIEDRDGADVVVIRDYRSIRRIFL